eukprot:CAMPEP_0172921712 /NCGR_PEP_ID=MMETSP1075-20121228/206455_1 /TAXON_ID=2916 /ORGANISM="Ceratium fusus, Strain PA161109" /LENGTH=90 /DNA_ID=CAMNT_0013781913 /DNA_START=149 /DNA_END=421 /DNA_ORIENTATION=-
MASPGFLPVAVGLSSSSPALRAATAFLQIARSSDGQVWVLCKSSVKAPRNSVGTVSSCQTSISKLPLEFISTGNSVSSVHILGSVNLTGM